MDDIKNDFISRKDAVFASVKAWVISKNIDEYRDNIISLLTDLDGKMPVKKERE